MLSEAVFAGRDYGKVGYACPQCWPIVSFQEEKLWESWHQISQSFPSWDAGKAERTILLACCEYNSLFYLDVCFCYRSYPCSYAEIWAIRNLLNLLKCMNCYGSMGWMSATETVHSGLIDIAAIHCVVGILVPLKTTLSCI